MGKFFDPYRGGIETVLRDLCQELESQVELHVLVANTRARTVHEQRGFRITRAANWGTLFSSPITPGFPGWVRKLPGDIVHVHLPNPVGEMSYLLTARDRPLVAHFHSDIVRQKSLLRIYAPLLRSFYDRVSCIVVPTPNHIDVSPFVSQFRNKCRIVPFGIPLEKFNLTSSGQSKVQQLCGDKPVILFIGRLVYYKGVEYLIQAMSKLDARLWIIGTGPLETSLRQMASSMNLQNKVSFLGNIADDQLLTYYHACDVFVLPSIANSEMFGMVQLEAMACGKPVVSTNLPTGVSWVNQHGVTGFLVPPQRPDALAETIQKLLKNPSLRQEMGEAGRKRVETEFTARKMAAGIMDVYREVMSSQ